ncbi:FAD-dependent pyridine nucleotide-disulphide oxidoreductase [hydrothermal vent metagenome]|uniref:FAD-dependent pyridine nucleotide-disulphide oxidoreductase n=1 Tax=hydrothermal vent metagenome TaxID=652676 RepID=A0A1W1EII9_9ZZZZ
MASKVLVLGGGLAGLESAIHLREYGFEVTLISNRDYLYIYPTSIWIPTGEASFEDTCIDLKQLSNIHGFELIIDEITAIKSLESIVKSENNSYSYDYLVVAIGSGKMKHRGQEHTLTICGEPKESLEIKDRLDKLIAKGSGKIAMGFGGNPKDSSNVRGGPAFEVLFNVHNKLKKLGIRDKFELTFFAPMAEPGKRMGSKALKMMDIFFDKLDIKKQVGKKILEFKEDRIIFEDNIELESDLTMFISAGDGHKVFQNSDLPLNESGFVHINDYCEVVHDYDNTPDKYNVFVIGDSAALEGPDWRAKQGHIAEVMARNTAYNIKMIEEGSSSFNGYKEHINILCVMDSGDGAAFVYRSDKRAMMLPMPIIGHWMKKGWGWYYKNSKLKKMFRLPGM